MIARVSGATPSSGEMRDGAGRFKVTAERNPLGLALAGAAVGFVAGPLAPSTRFEDEKVGPISDQVKSQAADVGEEALEHGKQVAQAVAVARREQPSRRARNTARSCPRRCTTRRKKRHRARADPSRRRLGAPPRCPGRPPRRNGKMTQTETLTPQPEQEEPTLDDVGLRDLSARDWLAVTKRAGKGCGRTT